MGLNEQVRKIRLQIELHKRVIDILLSERQELSEGISTHTRAIEDLKLKRRRLIFGR